MTENNRREFAAKYPKVVMDAGKGRGVTNSQDKREFSLGPDRPPLVGAGLDYADTYGAVSEAPSDRIAAFFKETAGISDDSGIAFQVEAIFAYTRFDDITRTIMPVVNRFAATDANVRKFQAALQQRIGGVNSEMDSVDRDFGALYLLVGGAAAAAPVANYVIADLLAVQAGTGATLTSGGLTLTQRTLTTGVLLGGATMIGLNQIRQNQARISIDPDAGRPTILPGRIPPEDQSTILPSPIQTPEPAIRITPIQEPVPPYVETYTQADPIGPQIYTNDGPLDPAAEGIPGVLANADRAIIDPRKLTEYALNPAHPVGGNKARVFESAFGFNAQNADDLLGQIARGVRENPAVAGKVDQYGSRFTVDIPVIGPKGGGTVRTGWIYKSGSNVPELTTLFPK